MSKDGRNIKILALRGKKSFSLIAAELGLTRNIVAGVIWRARHPVRTRYASADRRNSTGTGHHGHGPYAAVTLPRGRLRKAIAGASA